MKLHTVIISYNRLPLLQETIASYQATVTVPHTLLVVDNGSNAETVRWLRQGVPGATVMLLGTNLYPGPATNMGFDSAPVDATHLHRSDNDMRYLPGWCAELAHVFARDPKIAQVGLRTDAEELHTELNVGGTAVFRRALWDAGLRYREDGWPTLGTMTEDYWISAAIDRLGYRWRRVQRPCVVHLGTGDLKDPYYQHSFGVRGIVDSEIGHAGTTVRPATKEGQMPNNKAIGAQAPGYHAESASEGSDPRHPKPAGGTATAEKQQEGSQEGSQDYTEMTNDELREELTRRGQPTSGTKRELVERLEEHDSSN